MRVQKDTPNLTPHKRGSPSKELTAPNTPITASRFSTRYFSFNAFVTKACALKRPFSDSHMIRKFTTVFSRSPASGWLVRSEEHTSELQSLMRISYAVFCLKTKTTHTSAENP